jgi:mono/diheme cytochrome c family protein
LNQLILKGLEKELKSQPAMNIVTDEQFLRRVTLDLLGRQPTFAESVAFEADLTSEKRERLVEQHLQNLDFGRNWSNYWSDTISYHVSPPELTFLNYQPFKDWMAGQIHQNKTWPEITAAILTGTGKVKDQPQATFVAYHQGTPVSLAAETARVFLGLQIQCAECHDHPYDTWRREEFHHMAAFFARASVKMPRNKGIETVVSAAGKGEYYMPNAADPDKKGTMMLPTFLTSNETEKGESGWSDGRRRQRLAEFITSPQNPWFAKSFVNRVWARLMGQGFYEPVDNIGEFRPQLMPEVHEALAARFTATGGDVKDIFRLIVNTEVYQQTLTTDQALAEKPFAAGTTTKLRSDEVFDSLVTAINLPNKIGKQGKATAAIRFPPPPKSTRDLVADAFGFDPSRQPVEISRTLTQAMWMMNNKQLQTQINAKPGSGTTLSGLIGSDKDDSAVIRKLFRIVLARKPSDKEVKISLEHIQQIKNRADGFEDLLWSLLNSAEFTTKR